VNTILSLIAAFDDNRLIGTGGKLPWKLPADVAHFRQYTQGKWILVGRCTFEEMRGWFTDHTPLILTSQEEYDASPGCTVASVPEALRLALVAEQPELVCIGGGKVFDAALPYADRLVLTYVKGKFEAGDGAAYFPGFNAEEWEETESQSHPADAEHAQEMRFVTLQRK